MLVDSKPPSTPSTPTQPAAPFLTPTPSQPTPPNPSFDRDERTFAVIGAAIEVHRTLGVGFLERVYQLALAQELASRGIPFAAEVELPIHYKGERLACGYRVDFLCFGELVVETKAIKCLGPIEAAQVLNYLKAGSFATGLLLNFGDTQLEVKRLSGPAALAPRP